MRSVVPGITEVKRPASYWVDLYAWLVEGGLEVIHEWACDYVKTHGCIGTGDEAPVSSAKEKLIRASRSEGQQLTFDLAVSTLKREDAVVLTDKNIREWLREVRQIPRNDSTLESRMTIRTQLREAGMHELFEHKVGGVRFTAFANRRAMEKIAETVQKPVAEWTWNDVKDYQKLPGTIVEEDDNDDEPM